MKKRRNDFDGKPLARPKPEEEKGIIRQVKSGLDVYNGGDPDEPPPKQEMTAPSGGCADVIPIAEDETSRQGNVMELRSHTAEI